MFNIDMEAGMVKSGWSALSYQAGIHNPKEQAVALMTELCCQPSFSQASPVAFENVYLAEVYSGDKTIS